MIQRSLILQGTAAIKRIEAEEIEVDRLVILKSQIGGGGGGGGGAVSLSNITDWPSNVSAAEVNYLDGAYSNIQSQLNGKQASGNYLTSIPSNTDAARIADGSVSNTKFQHLNGVTSGIQSQLDGIQSQLAGKQASGNYLTSVPSNTDAARIADGSVSNTKFQHLNGVTSGIQSQLDGIQSQLAGKQASGNYISSPTTTASGFLRRNATNTGWEVGHLQLATGEEDLIQWLTTSGSGLLLLYNANVEWNLLFEINSKVIISGVNTSIGGIPATDVNGEKRVSSFYSDQGAFRGFYVLVASNATSSSVGSFSPYATLKYGVAPITVTVNSASGGGNLTINSSALTYTPPSLSAYLTAVPFNTDAALIADGSVSNSKFQHLNGVTSGIQSQLDGIQSELDGKQASGNYLTSVPFNTDAALIADGSVSNSKFQHLNGVTSGIQSQLDGIQSELDGKQASGNYLTSVPFNTDAALIADGSVSNSKFQHLNGVTSGIQSQLDGIQSELDGKQASGNYLTSVPDLSNTYLSLSSGGTVSGNTTFTGTLTGTASGNLTETQGDDRYLPLPSGTPSANEVVQWSGSAWVFNTISQPFFQMVNLETSLVNYGDSNPQTDDVPTSADDWRKYLNWDTSTYLTNDSSNFSVNQQRIKVKSAGYYRVTCLFFFYSVDTRVTVGSRVGKNSTMEGPIANNSYIRNATGHNSSSTHLSHILSCSLNDEISVHTARFGASGTAKTPAGYSQFRVEKI
jgi:hypothetical protein